MLFPGKVFLSEFSARFLASIEKRFCQYQVPTDFLKHAYSFGVFACEVGIETWVIDYFAFMTIFCCFWTVFSATK